MPLSSEFLLRADSSPDDQLLPVLRLLNLQGGWAGRVGWSCSLFDCGVCLGTVEGGFLTCGAPCHQPTASPHATLLCSALPCAALPCPAGTDAFLLWPALLSVVGTDAFLLFPALPCRH